jgi:3-deoxy-D-manno-octulosonate 8-phosphate phosphatase (KDO 8-P phosphatase)
MEIQEEFESIGGIFVHPLQTLIKKFKGIKAFVFDWDGVFNNAQKNENKSSTFNEADSMGTNLIRYDYYSQGTMHQHNQKDLQVPSTCESSASLERG